MFQNVNVTLLAFVTEVAVFFSYSIFMPVHTLRANVKFLLCEHTWQLNLLAIAVAQDIWSMPSSQTNETICN